LFAGLHQEYIAPSKKTVREVAEDWFDKRFANNAYERATRVERKNHVENYIIPAFGAMLVQNLTVERIEKQKQMTEWNQKVKPLVVNRVLRTLANILGEAKKYKYIKDNPAKEADRLKGEKSKKKEIFTADELRRVIEATEEGSRERVIVMTLAFTGCRVGELLAASWSAIDLKAGLFSVSASLADGDEGPVVKKPKSESSFRTIPLSKELVHELRIWKLKCPPSELDLVIASDLGKPIHRIFVCHMLKRIRKSLKIDRKLTAHSFRHTFASLLLAQHRPVPEVSNILGHKNPAITMSIYAHPVPGEETGAVQDYATSILATPVPL
jgi:integrase